MDYSEVYTRQLVTVSSAAAASFLRMMSDWSRWRYVRHEEKPGLTTVYMYKRPLLLNHDNNTTARGRIRQMYGLPIRIPWYFGETGAEEYDVPMFMNTE
jgi:hypothetical protein